MGRRRRARKVIPSAVSCAYCPQPAEVTCRSYRSFGAQYQAQALPGHCSRCLRPFCRQHHGFCYFYDDDCGTLGASYFCTRCVEVENEEREKDNAAVRQRAQWWWNHVPLLGMVVYACLMTCCRRPPLTPIQR